MYIYFDKNRVLREIINDKVTAVSSGNEFIYAYFEGQENENTHEQEYLAAVIRYRLPDGTLIPISGTQSGEEEDREIPPNKNRDLKYFRYGKTYKFNKWEIDVTTLENGTVAATITYPSNTVMELFTFTVEDSVVDLSQSMSMSDYQYLVQLFMNKEVFAINGINTADLTQYPDNALIFDINTRIVWKKISVSPYKEQWTDLADKYTQSQINAFLALKADITYVDEQLALKANSTDVYDKDTANGRFVHLEGSENIDGLKVFRTNIPQNASDRVYDPEKDNELADTKFVKDITGNPDVGKTLQEEIVDVDAKIDNYIPLSQKDAANGVATLDGDKKIPLSQIPDSILGQLEYCGVWDASSSENQTERIRKGDYYVCNVAGYHTPDGVLSNLDFELGDWCICDGLDENDDPIWEKVDNTDAVQSVNGQKGAVDLTANDIPMSSEQGAEKVDVAIGNLDTRVTTLENNEPKFADVTLVAGSVEDNGDWAWDSTDEVFKCTKAITGLTFTATSMIIYCGVSGIDNVYIGTYGIRAVSNNATQNFTFTVEKPDTDENNESVAPNVNIAFRICVIGGN